MQSETLETATLGGGCFWCLEAVFQALDGVESVVSGYAGGSLPDPDYRQVCSGASGHAEVVQIRYDPRRLSFEGLLEVFFAIHNPTTPNRQGHDVGPQYRSIILYADDDQQARAREVMARVADQWADPLVTELVPLERFYPAEDHHQNYYRNNAGAPYCQMVIAPKLARAREYFHLHEG
ncbi:peptide-methionine (S)-S-oxide reductase MsrA [Alkalilimnicola sp. S0819]|uniref:peptide-methionine (S)-S-oxide reductase MsrA n=1 Tax=Alkalilimnicola sp. S0819 TaxID=2613922 RepID=UPI0012617C56|nr:peptide-methionine (S)-S-oxide reductase MsrA [Alkalilimnicola sp. S0819]KAB7622786.1 peptide-methionine (S)-S-oxide reductase MsrA [Alkalilimnicola sp. S0819]MPQ17282.1 peptide-methionine (S)-S-oxide reductase MsrA [Alkalilimnicola sp. S0819]